MSEWGNPASQDVTAQAEPTLGTETSQYREEKKSTEIFLVAVSEREIGQTEGACSFGVVGPQRGMYGAKVKRPGKARQRR
jgi:cellobiose-specific phosphotransferase system component IIB